MPSIYLAAMVFSLMGMHNNSARIIVRTIFMENIPNLIMGRVQTIFGVYTRTMVLLSSLFAGWLVESHNILIGMIFTSFHYLLAFIGIIASMFAGFLGVMYFIIFRRVWLVEDPLPMPGFEATLKLLEPIMRVEVVTPEDYMGDVIGDLNSRRGQVQEMSTRGNANVVDAMVPLANMFGYVNNLRSLSQGRANYTMQFDHYEEVPSNVAEEVKAKLA